MSNNNPMMEKYVEVSWCPADVKDIYPEWSDDKCIEMLNKVSRYVEDRWIELGWEVLETHLDLEERNA
jgi:hypothetical protein